MDSCCSCCCLHNVAITTNRAIAIMARENRIFFGSRAVDVLTAKRRDAVGKIKHWQSCDLTVVLQQISIRSRTGNVWLEHLGQQATKPFDVTCHASGQKKQES